jgi:hypothetical protein
MSLTANPPKALFDISFGFFQRYNEPMIFRVLTLSCFLITLGFGAPSLAQTQPGPSSTNPDPAVDSTSPEGFAKPYTYERKAYGYDPEGVDYKENQVEDFQVVFITSTPFTAGASFLLTGFTSLLVRNSFEVSGDYFIPFIAGTLAGSTAIACVSTLSNPYPPPASQEYVRDPSPLPPLAFNLPVVSARF